MKKLFFLLTIEKRYVMLIRIELDAQKIGKVLNLNTYREKKLLQSGRKVCSYKDLEDGWVGWELNGNFISYQW